MKTLITLIRAAIGWHFLYEGIIKLFAGNWSAESYLNNTQGFFSGFYHWLVTSPLRLEVVDFLNIWGLILIGLGLFLGVLSRWASLAGALLLTLYYFAYPPFGVSLIGSDSTVYIVNLQLIEAATLVFLFYFKEKGYGLDALIPFYKKKKQSQLASDDIQSETEIYSRREALKNLATLPVLGLFGWGGYKNTKIYGVDTLSGATVQINQMQLNELKGELPKGKLGNFELTRLIAGSGMFSGGAHSRDLLYVNQLFRAYNTERKIFETLMLFEQAGINCIFASHFNIKVIAKYKKLTGSKLIVNVYTRTNEKGEMDVYNRQIEKGDDMFRNLKEVIDMGADMITVQGAQCDEAARGNKVELVGKFVDEIRRQGYVAGLGAHTVDSLIICEENGIIPDFYFKTMHHDDYWSATPRENRTPFIVSAEKHKDHNMFHDNLWCPFPDRTIEFVNQAKVPVVGFKVLAAGAIPPEDGFNWAFENGADFICVGMFDFQVVKNINTCIDTLQNLQNRKRAWYS